MDFSKINKAFEERDFGFKYFDTKEDASDYLLSEIQGTTVGLGGSMTLKDMGLYEKLSGQNQVSWHWIDKVSGKKMASEAKVYIMSANGISKTGEIINIDGAGNRASAMLYGHERVYIVAGVNKLEDSYEDALWRARNIAAPKNARRLKADTPCALKGDRCYDCRSPQRICRGIVTLLERPLDIEHMEIVLINEDLGY